GVVHELHATRVSGPPTHGTGCTLSAGVAAALAIGHDLVTAVSRARRYVRRALAGAAAVGGGARPPAHPGGADLPRQTSTVDKPPSGDEASPMDEDDSLTPSLLLAMPQLRDPNFSRTVVLLCEHGPEGSVGFVVNRPTEIRAASAVALDPPPKRDSGLR